MTVLRMTTKMNMDARDPHWRERGEGVSEYWMHWAGNAQLRVHPYVEGSVMTVGYLERPIAIVLNDNEQIDSRIPEAHHIHLTLAAAAKLLLKDCDKQDLAQSQALMAAFNGLIGGSK